MPGGSDAEQFDHWIVGRHTDGLLVLRGYGTASTVVISLRASNSTTVLRADGVEEGFLSNMINDQDSEVGLFKD